MTHWNGNLIVHYIVFGHGDRFEVSVACVFHGSTLGQVLLEATLSGDIMFFVIITNGIMEKSVFRLGQLDTSKGW